MATRWSGLLAWPVALLALSACGPSPGTALQAPSPEVAHDVELRARFGLEADPDRVAEIRADPESVGGALYIPMTRAEQAEMDRRNQVGFALSKINAVLDDRARAAHAGNWIDQAGGGIAVVATTDPSTLSRERIAAVLPSGAPLEIRKVDCSTSELEHLEIELRSEVTQGGFLMLDVMTNHVLLHLPPGDEAHRDDLERRYPTPCLRVSMLDAPTQSSSGQVQ